MSARVAAIVLAICVALRLAIDLWILSLFVLFVALWFAAALLGRWTLRARLDGVAETLQGRPVALDEEDRTVVLAWGELLEHEVRATLRHAARPVTFELASGPDALPEQIPGYVDARRGRRVLFRARIPCRRRGAFIYGPLWAHLSDRTGLFDPHPVRACRAHFVEVLPRTVPLDGLALAIEGVETGEGVRRRRPGAPPDIVNVRQYEAGDPLSVINWYATAQAGTLMSHVYEADPPVETRVYVVLDLDGGDQATERHEELLVTITASVVAHLAGGLTGGHQAGRYLGLLASGAHAVRRPAHWDHGRGAWRLRRALVRVRPGAEASLEGVLPALYRQARRRGRDVALLITARAPEEHGDLVERMRRRGVTVRVIQVVEGQDAVTSWPVPALLVPAELGDPRLDAELAATLAGEREPAAMGMGMEMEAVR
jgi:uncharacterized protein (DUF58 family)